jgi:uncharacterized membrane protein
MSTAQSLARALGLFSLGLGVYQLAAPRQFVQTIGMRPKPERETEARVVGARELAAAAGLLARPMPVAWMWMRVAGDAMDLALLRREMTKRDVQPNRLGSAFSATAAITAIDVLGSVVATREAMRNGKDFGALTIGRRAHGGTSTSTPVATKKAARKRPVIKAVTVDRSRDEVYDYWHDFENFPLFMEHLEAVTVAEDGRSHWVAKGPGGTRIEWDAETTEDIPNERISWQSLSGSEVRHKGTVRFEDAPGDRGTIVRVEMTYDPPGGPLGVALAKVMGEEPAIQVADDLRHFKQLIETGDVVVSEATAGGRRLRQRPARPLPPQDVVEEVLS